VSIDRTSAALIAAITLALVSAAGCRHAEPEQTTQAEPGSPPAGKQFGITLDTGGPLKMKAAPLEVTVRENGKPAAGVDVSVELRMPPAGAMGEMRTGAFLMPAGGGHYRGQVDMMMAGQWIAIVRVKRNGEVVATHTQPVTAE
jgi:hypothetical protein